jgi:hypothetical protein
VAIKTSWLTKRVARLTGDKGTKVNEGTRYRVEVTSVDGHVCGVSVQINTHAPEVRPYQMKEIAERWHVDRADLDDVLENWTPEQLRERLEAQTKKALMPARGRSSGQSTKELPDGTG